MKLLESTCQNKNIDFIVANNHVRCLAHIINLGAQDALSSLKVGYVESDDEIIDNANAVTEVIPKVKIIYDLIFIINVILIQFLCIASPSCY